MTMLEIEDDACESSLWQTLVLLLDDFLRERWGDSIALVLIFWGLHYMRWNTSAGWSLITGGMAMLRPKTMQAGDGGANGNGNGVHAPVEPGNSKLKEHA